MSKPRLIAYYLPQYHPIPENDAWWGKGFTEWTNVASAKPLFPGHYQPHIPADLGFYDLRVPEVREAQAAMARRYGIEGFCYWHYWFGGKRLLERPFAEVLESGKPDFPFCLAWANQSWTGVWYGNPGKILVEQTYPGIDDHRAHFNALLPAFRDQRYLRVDGKALFFVFVPSDLNSAVLDLWREMAHKAGLTGLFMVGIVKNTDEARQIREMGFDACTISRTSGRAEKLPFLRAQIVRWLGKKRAAALYQKVFRQPFHVYHMEDLKPYVDVEGDIGMDFYPCVMPNWDNTPRSGVSGQVWAKADPEIFEKHVRLAAQRVADYPEEHRFVIVKSWNEWAEGNHLEPDQRFGRAFLEALQRGIGEL